MAEFSKAQVHYQEMLKIDPEFSDSELDEIFKDLTARTNK